MSEQAQNDEAMMRRALVLAENGRGRTYPNPMVGCVLTAPDGRVIGEGWHHGAGLPHAEVEAIENAKDRGESTGGATAYVTLEPCNHHGRTGPCSEALLAAKVARVVIATGDPNQTATGGAARLRAAGVQVEVGLLGTEARLLNAAFLTFHQLQRPLVTLKWAMTLDGCTSMEGGDSKWITSEAAREEVHRRRAQHGAVVAGIGTVIRDGARLSARPAESAAPRFPLWRVVLDGKLRLPPESPFAQQVPGQPALVCTRKDASPRLEAELTRRGIEVERLPMDEAGRPSVQHALGALRKRQIQSVCIEGGRLLAGSFLKAGLVDRVECWIAPKIVGGGASHLGPTTMEPPLTSMKDALDLYRIQSSAYGPDLLIEGWISHHLD